MGRPPYEMNRPLDLLHHEHPLTAFTTCICVSQHVLLPNIGDQHLEPLTCHVSDVFFFTLWLFNSLPWYRWPIEIDGFPIKIVIFHGELLNNWIFFVANSCQIQPEARLFPWMPPPRCLDQTWTKALEIVTRPGKHTKSY